MVHFSQEKMIRWDLTLCCFCSIHHFSALCLLSHPFLHLCAKPTHPGSAMVRVAKEAKIRGKINCQLMRCLLGSSDDGSSDDE